MRTIFKNVYVVTVNEENEVIQNGVVEVRDGQIVYVGDTLPQDLAGARVIDGAGKKALLPGFVDGHTHLPMVLFRGGADDMELHTWLNDRIFPLEAKETPESVTYGALLALSELARAGVTTINDMYTQNRALIPALEKLPLRATLSMGLFGQAENAGEQLADNVRFFHEYNGALGGLVRVGLGPHAEYTATAPFLRKCADTARELGCPLHIHVSETKKEHVECRARHGLTPVGLLDREGFFDGNRALLAHCVWLEEEDMDILARKGASVLHNPCSNMKLGSGFAPIPAMLSRGIKIALSTDGAASNNSLDLWEEMRLCGLMHKGNNLDATAVRAPEALYMATRGAALALGYADVGSIREGFQADLCLVDLDQPYYHPMTDLVHHIVYGGSSRDVEMTMVAGRVVYEAGKPMNVDLDEVYERVQYFYDHLFNV
jgi:5-methylthioadenosine/S-adenosylhomocysteine deaminase